MNSNSFVDDTGQRSWPSRGAPVVLWLGDSRLHGDMHADADGDVVSGSDHAEDFSTCTWGDCVKVKPGVDNTHAARLIRKIADVFEKDCATSV